MKKAINILVMSSLCQFLSTVVAADDAEERGNVLEQMFAWWNGAIRDPDGFTEEAFRRYYTEDAAIVINGAERVSGIKNLVEHFKKIQSRVETVEIVLPFEEGFESGNRIFTYHKIRSRAEGEDSLSHVMGYAIIEDGKIALVDFLSYEPPHEDLQTDETDVKGE